MEIVTVKIELERDDISAMLRLLGYKLSEEMWNEMKDKECTLDDEDMEDQVGSMKFMFSVLAVSKLLKEDCNPLKRKEERNGNGLMKRINAIGEKYIKRITNLKRKKHSLMRSNRRGPLNLWQKGNGSSTLEDGVLQRLFGIIPMAGNCAVH